MKEVPAEISTFSFAFWGIVGSCVGISLDTVSPGVTAQDFLITLGMAVSGMIGTLYNAKALQ